MEPTFTPQPVPATPRPVGSLLGDALRRPGGRRAISVLSLVLFLAGAGMFAYPVGTDLYSRYKQGQLSGAFDDPKVREAYRLKKIGVGQGLTRLRIPKIGVDVLVVEGTTPAALRAGAGHYMSTPLPGEAGNVAIAGHRTTFGRPLNRMDELVPGDVVELETPFSVFTYKAVKAFAGHANPWVVKPTDLSVVAQEGVKKGLTLTTCHPKGSAKQRLVMRFELVGEKPVDKDRGKA
jgi:sortase A